MVSGYTFKQYENEKQENDMGIVKFFEKYLLVIIACLIIFALFLYGTVNNDVSVFEIVLLSFVSAGIYFFLIALIIKTTERITVNPNNATLFCILIFVLPIILVAVFSNNQINNMGNNILNVGEIAETYNITGGDIPATTDQISYKVMEKSLYAKDNQGISNLALEGKLFFIKNNTKTLVIDITFAGVQVRILEGDYQGKTCWIMYSFLKSKNSD